MNVAKFHLSPKKNWGYMHFKKNPKYVFKLYPDDKNYLDPFEFPFDHSTPLMGTDALANQCISPEGSEDNARGF